MGVAIRAEGFSMAYGASLFALGRIELMPHTEIVGVVHRCPAIGMAVAADGEARYFHRVFCSHALRMCAGKKYCRERREQQ